MYKYERTNNYPNDPQMQYYSYDVFKEDEEGFEYVCECLRWKDAKMIVDALNKTLESD